MRKIQSFFTGIFLLVVVFAMLVLTTLVYRAHERSLIKTYVFQTNNSENYRGVLQNINDISAVDLRNKLIKKYISEYFKVIPGDSNPTNRPILYTLSSGQAWDYWKTNEVPDIIKMSDTNMFRMAHIDDDGIAILNKTDAVDTTQPVYYIVRYKTLTWSESNNMAITPFASQGTIYIEARFKPGIKDEKYIVGFDKQTNRTKHMTLREYLESGNDPSGLFMFEVTNIGDKVVK